MKNCMGVERMESRVGVWGLFFVLAVPDHRPYGCARPISLTCACDSSSSLEVPLSHCFPKPYLNFLCHFLLFTTVESSGNLSLGVCAILFG